MMETTLVSMSLEEELQALQKALSSRSTFTCHGKPTKGTQCGNPLSKPTKTKLDALIRRIIELLKNAGEGIEKLLEEMSSLVMCVRYHQGQAPDKCNAWVKRIPVSKCTDLQEEGGKSHPRGSPFPTSSEDVPKMVESLEPLSDNPEFQSAAGSNLHSYNKASSVEDPGYESDDDRVTDDNHPVASVAVTTGRSSGSKGLESPETPKRPPPMPTTDSGYMSLERPTTVTIKTEQCPPSPSAARGRRGKSQRPSKTSRPEPTPIQLKSSPVAESSGPIPPARKVRPSKSSSSWSPWNDPNKGMKKCIQGALGSRAMKDGRIYAFTIDGCKFYKIGYAARREGEKSLEDSLNKRIREHERCGWHNPEKVLDYCVPHAYRVEKIIHHHLEEDRQREHNLCKEIDGQKCKHIKHTEWFDTPYNRIHVVTRAWKRWIELKPYVKINRQMCLSPEWQKNLEAVSNQKSGDNWLQWLDYYAPGPAITICEIESKEIHGAGITTLAENANSAVAIDGTGTGDDDASDGEMTAQKTRAPRTRLEFKLLSSRTWPRRTKAMVEE